MAAATAARLYPDLTSAAIGMQQGYVQNNEFSAVIGMVVVTTLITPPLLLGLFESKQVPGSAAGKDIRHTTKETTTREIETREA